MAADRTVIDTLLAGLENDPNNLALRLHAAKLLLESKSFDEALAHVRFALQKQPDHPQAIELAIESSEETGDLIAAAGYRKLAEALTWRSASRLVESQTEDLCDEAAPKERMRWPTPSTELWADSDDEQLDDADEIHQIWQPTESDITLADVAGMEEVKRRLELGFLGPLKNPDLRKLFAKSLRGGLMLYGPPGCGKTYLARALAGEIGARFMSVSIDDVLHMWIGRSEQNLKSFFEAARRHSPCVLFFDEIDALGRKRSLIRDLTPTNVVNQLLAELDGVGSDNEGLYVVAATNHPWDVDGALTRPGRLDRTLLVLPPDQGAREAIIRMNLAGRPIEEIDVAQMAVRAEDYSGADIAHLCETAAEFALEDSVRTGVTRPIRMSDMKNAFKEVRASIRPWLETAKNYALFANDGGTYDELLSYLRKRKIV